MEVVKSCFVPGCSNQVCKFSFFTFHRMPKSRGLREEILEVLHLPSSTPMDHHSVMCSAHFAPMIERTDLVLELLDSMISNKPPPAASSMVPRCAAVGCCVNLYSQISLFKFPPEGRRFDLWRMVAGCPKKSDCFVLCARHFKRDSFHNNGRTSLKEGAIPVFPTRPLNPTFKNYCPLKPPAPSSSIVGRAIDDPIGMMKAEYSKKWRCGAVGCDVTSESHPFMRKITFPADPERLSLWREIVGYVPTTKYSNYLCTRHFGLNQFYDGELRRNAVKMSNPMYPTGPLNLNTLDYCPPELDLTLNIEHWSGLEEGSDSEEMSCVEDAEPFVEDDDSRAEVIIVSEDNRRCSADGCPVTSVTHPNVKLYNFPKKSHEKFDSWMKLVSHPINGALSLCVRHFDKHQRDRIPKYPFGDLDSETETYKPVFNPLEPKCCVPDCESTLEGGVTFHRFPLKHAAFQTWVERIGWKKLELYDQGDVFRGFRVCSKHFIDDCFIRNGNSEIILSENAVPTMFLGGDKIVPMETQDDLSSGIEVEFQEVDNTDSDEVEGEEIDRIQGKSRKRRWTEVFFVADYKKRGARAPAEEQCLLECADDSASGSELDGGDGVAKSLQLSEESDSEGPVSADSHVDDFLRTTAAICGFSHSQTVQLLRVRGKHRRALSALRDALANNLNEIVNLMGLDFVRDCLTFRRTLPLGLEEPSGSCPNSFAARLSLLSAQCFTAYSKVIALPTLSEVYNRMRRVDGSPGFNSFAWTKLDEQAHRSDSFIVSLNVLEVPLKRQIDYDGSDLFGYVDLGFGVANNLAEASTAIVFFANSVTHHFQVPLGYCLVDSLSPRLRANLIRQYLIMLKTVFNKFDRSRCLSVVCENLSTTYETFRELGVEIDNLRKGHFDHPTNKERVFCFVDNNSALRSMKNLILSSGHLMSNNSPFVVNSSNLNIFDNLDIEQPSTLPSQHVTVGQDVAQFKKESATILAILRHKRNKSKKYQYNDGELKYEERVELLTVMESIFKLFNSQNVFCKESPAVNPKNVKSTLRRIRSYGIYLETLRDEEGVELVRGGKRHLIQGLVMNLMSLAGYLLQVFSRGKTKQPKTVKCRSLTLGSDRAALESVTTALELRLESMVKWTGPRWLFGWKRSFNFSTWPSLAHLARSPPFGWLERYDAFVTRRALLKWAEDTGCPECAAIAVREMCRGEVETGFVRSVRRLFRSAETALRLVRVQPHVEYPRFVVAVLDEIAFDGFLPHDHLFNSVEFGAITHFATMIHELLRIYFNLRAEPAPNSRQVVIGNENPHNVIQSLLRSSWI